MDGCGVSVDWDSLTVTDTEPEGLHYRMKPCLRFLFYLQGEQAEVEQGLLAFYALALPYCRNESRFHFKPLKARYGGNGYVKMAKNTKQTWQYLDDCLAGKVSGERFGLLVETSDNPYGISDTSLDVYYFRALQSGYVALTLPVDHFHDDFPRCAGLADELAAAVPFRTGYVGYSVNIAFANQSIRRWKETPVYHLSRRYLGIDFRLPYDFIQFEDPNESWFVPQGVTNLAWITYLRNDLAEQVELSNIIVRKLERGLGIQADVAPSVLPADKSDRIEPYRDLAKRLRPLGLRKEMVGRSDLIGGEENTQWWIERFFN